MKTLLSSKILLALPIVFLMGCEGKVSPTPETTEEVAYVTKKVVDYSLLKNFIAEVHVLESSYPEIYNELISKVNNRLNYNTISPTTTATTKSFSAGVYKSVLDYCIKEGHVTGELVEQKGKSYHKLNNTPELDQCIDQRFAQPVEFQYLSDLTNSIPYRMFKNHPVLRTHVKALKEKKQMTNADLLKLYHELAALYAEQEQNAIQILIDDL